MNLVVRIHTSYALSKIRLGGSKNASFNRVLTG